MIVGIVIMRASSSSAEALYTNTKYSASDLLGGPEDVVAVANIQGAVS
jgi:hypothetical protein